MVVEQLLKAGTDNRAHMDAIKYVCSSRSEGYNLTLIEQNPYSGKGPTIGRALIVCPVSLINVSWKILSFLIHAPLSFRISNISHAFAELESRVPQMDRP